MSNTGEYMSNIKPVASLLPSQRLRKNNKILGNAPDSKRIKFQEVEPPVACVAVLATEWSLIPLISSLWSRSPRSPRSRAGAGGGVAIGPGPGAVTAGLAGTATGWGCGGQGAGGRTVRLVGHCFASDHHVTSMTMLTSNAN